MFDIPNPVGRMHHLLKNWWKIVTLAILGGLLGLAASFIIPPTFEAEAIFSASIDFTKVRFDHLAENGEDRVVFTQYEEDLALQVVHDVLLTQMSKALEYAQTLDPTLDQAIFSNNNQIRRFHALWYLRYRHENPQVAQAIVNYWAEEGYKALRQAQMDGVVEDFVIIDLVSLANLPTRPIVQHRNTIVLAGTLIGFLSGILLLDYKNIFPKSTPLDATRMLRSF